MKSNFPKINLFHFVAAFKLISKNSKPHTFFMKRIVFLLFSVLTLFSTEESYATHFRYGHLTWQKLSGNTVQFKLVNAFRRNGYVGTAGDGFPAVGDVIEEHIGTTTLDFGDGDNTPVLEYKVISIDVSNNWLLGQALEPGSTTKTTIDHTYPSSGPWTAEINSCCRTSGEQNNPDGDYQVSTIVETASGNTSPGSSLPAIVNLIQSATASFFVPGADPDPSTTLKWRLASSSEAGTGFDQPTAGSEDLTVNNLTGLVSWNTLAAVLGGLYSCQIIIEDYDAVTGALKTQVAVDFLILIVECDPDNVSPAFVAPSPTCGSTIPATVGSPVSFTVTASDADAADIVSLNSGGVPSGATLTPGLPSDGNPISTTFDWTPGAGDNGTHVVTFSATDDCGAQALCSYTIDVTCNCDDADLCTADECIRGVCFNTPVSCDDGNPCTDDFCNGGCYHTSKCDDGNSCTDDHCNNGVCSNPSNCDDGNSCTTDICNRGQCTYTPGLLDLNFDKRDMSCYCASTQNQLCLLDFSNLSAGEQVSEQYAGYGIHIFAKANSPSGVIRPYVFNTNGSGSPDPDLEVGAGNALIIPVDNFTTNDDSDEGGEITFRFDTDRSILSMTVIDFDDPNCALCVVELYDKFNALIKTIPIPASGNGGVQTLPINTSGVREMVVKYTESGAITNIAFDCPQPCCDGSATANVSGGNSNTAYYVWATSSQQVIAEGNNVKTVNGLCPGTYHVLVFDEAGCSVTGTVTINYPDPQECANCDFDCTGECNGDAYIDGCGICVGGSTGKQPCSCYLSITSLTLVYEGFLGDIGPLTEGLVINRDNLCRFNIRANLCQSPAGSVKFVLNGTTTKIENGAPYAFWGDNAGSYKPWVAYGGSHTLVVTAYSGLNGTGTAGTPFVVHFTVTGSANSPACTNPPSICVGGCNDHNSCTTDACVNGNCVFTQKNCDDYDACTNDYCSDGVCYHDEVQSQPSYLRVVNPSKSWRKLKLGYSSTNLYSPKKNVSASGNNQLCITLRTVGTPEWNKIQIRPQGSSGAAVTLGNYISGSKPNWTTICIPLSAFSGFNFTQIAYMEIPYSNGAGAFEIHIQRIVFSGGGSPFLWFGDPHTNNKYEASSGLDVTLIQGAACGFNKLSDENLANQFTNNSEELMLNAYPNPFKEQLNFEFSVAEDSDVTLELYSISGAKITTLFEGNAKGSVLYKETFHPDNLSSGFYIFRLKTATSVITGKVLMTR